MYNQSVPEREVVPRVVSLSSSQHVFAAELYIEWEYQGLSLFLMLDKMCILKVPVSELVLLQYKYHAKTKGKNTQKKPKLFLLN